MKARSRSGFHIVLAATAGGVLAYAGIRALSSEPPAAGSSATRSVAAPRHAGPASASATPAGPPQLLYLPDGGDLGPGAHPGQRVLPGPWRPAGGACPEDMVGIGSAYCIDRYESSLVDTAQGRLVSPYYHPERGILQRTYGRWRNARASGDTELARSTAVPEPASWQLQQDFDVRAVSRAGVVPNGYMTRGLSARACENAGKRLCSEDEWVRACRGSAGRKFPYGDKYEHGRCNVFREAHPAAALHGNASINHTDPRLNQVAARGRPLLRKTGATAECASRWGDDAVFDMVGNLDEWVEDPEGVFVGGFYSRSTRSGCESKVSSHAPSYFDYSLGTRCCKSL